MDTNTAGKQQQTRKRLAKALAALLFCAPACLPAAAQRVHPQAGTSSAAFLEIGIGARPMGMGDAFTAVADDALAVYWNPAGLAGQDAANVNFTHDESFQGLRHEFLGYAQPLNSGPNSATLGLGLNSLFVPNDIERRSGSNENDPLSPLTNPQGTFGAYDMAASVSYARQWTHRQSLGGTVKYIRQEIDNQSGQTGAADLGWKMKQATPHLDLGAAIENIGPGVKFATRFPLPLTIRAGSVYRFDKFHSLLAFDLQVPRDDFPTVAFGFQIHPVSLLALRTGYQYRWYGNPLGALSGFRAGMSVDFNRFSVDYAFAPFGDLGNSQLVSLSWRFGDPKTTAAQPPADSAAPTAVVKAMAPAKPAQPIALAPVPSPTPPDKAFTRFRMKAAPKTISARGTEYELQASAPSEDWALRTVSFRAILETPGQAAVEAMKSAPMEPLPSDFSLIESVRFKADHPSTPKAILFTVKPTTKPGQPVSMLALIQGRWIPMAKVDGAENSSPQFWTESFPDAVAIGTHANASSDPPSPGR